MSNIPKPEDEKNLEFDIRYQPDMVLSGSLDATEPAMNYLQLSLGDEVYDLNRQLPDYSEASDGDVLQIDDGAPVWTAASGGGSDFLAVNIEISMTSLSAFSVTSCDKTGAEINAAAAAGTPIIAYLNVAGYGMKYTLVDPYISFTTAATDPAGVHGFIFQRDVTADSAIQLYIMEFEVANADPGSNPWGSGTLKNVKIAYT